ncbi:MAG TPA: aldo/keto reductase [Polyangiaceae bacterium]
MLTRRFGRTGLSIPVLTAGAMRYQQSWNAADPVTPENQANLEATLLRALDLGINHIETARGYGTSEKQLGVILPRLPRHQLIVQTKIGPQRDPDQFERDFLDSLKRLNLTYVDLLGIHGLNDRDCMDLTLRDGGCLERALSLKQRGLVRFVGFSTHAPLEVILDGIKDGRFDYVNLHYYWAFQQNLAAVRAAAARDMGILVISPNDKGGKLYEPPERLRRLTEPYSPMVYNDLFCLAHPELSTLSIGVSRPSDFEEHVKAVELYRQHAADPRQLIAPVEAKLKQELERALGKEWAEGWSTGLPEWQDMPGEINIREILRLYNLAKGLDMVTYGRMRYNLLENSGHWFPGRSAALVDEAAILAKLTDKSPFAKRIPTILREAHELLVGPKLQRLQQK